MHRYTIDQAIQLIRLFEGFVDHIYICSAGYKTVGIGHALKPGEDIRWTNGITEEQAYELLKQDIYLAESSVSRLIYTELSDGQFGALVSFSFNLGGGALQRSTMRSMINRYEYEGASEEFEKWCWAGGRKSAGVLRRRLAERGLFLWG